MPCYVWECFKPDNENGLAVVKAEDEEEAIRLLNEALDCAGYVSLNKGDGVPRRLHMNEVIYVFGGA